MGLTDLSVEELNGRRNVVVHLIDGFVSGEREVGRGGGEKVLNLLDRKGDALAAEEKLEASFLKEREKERERKRGGKIAVKEFVAVFKRGIIDCGISTSGSFLSFFFFDFLFLFLF